MCKINYKNDEHRNRVIIAIKLIREGLIGEELNATLRDQFGISRKTAEVFLAEARKIIKEDVKENAVILRESQIMRYLEIYKEAHEKGDLKTANNILANIDKLYGLASIKTEQSGEIVIKFE